MKKYYIIIIGIAIFILGGIYFKSFFYSKTETIEQYISYKHPVIPEGFHTVETVNASWEEDENGNIKGWNNGLVIEDESGNQFVWVPCSIDEDSNVVKYSRYYSTDNTTNVSSVGNSNITHLKIKTANGEEETCFYEDDDINSKVKNMVSRYGGFYIGKYELAAENGKTVTKGNCEVITNINRDTAIELTKNFINNDKAETYMITSYCYDTTIMWLTKSNNEFANNPYSDNVLISENGNKAKMTGENKEEFNNICDIIGNAIEMTTEKYNYLNNGIGCVGRGVMRKTTVEDSSYKISELFNNRGFLYDKSSVVGTRAILLVN